MAAAASDSAELDLQGLRGTASRLGGRRLEAPCNLCRVRKDVACIIPLSGMPQVINSNRNAIFTDFLLGRRFGASTFELFRYIYWLRQGIKVVFPSAFSGYYNTIMIVYSEIWSFYWMGNFTNKGVSKL